MSSTWTRPEDLVEKVRRRWDDGSLLRDYAKGRDLPPIELVVRGPKASQVGDDLDAVRGWVATLDQGRKDDRCYALQWQAIGGRSIGRNQLPVRAVINTYDQAWALLGVRAEVRRLDEVLLLAEVHPGVRSWVEDHPHRAIALRAELPQLLAAYGWLDDQRGSGRYLREISAPGVDTKLAEKHRAVLAAMLGVGATSTGFLAGLGLRAKPELVRFRPHASLGLTPGLTELAVRADELASVTLSPTSALVVENEVSYLSVPVPDGGLVLWGKGFEVDRVGRLPWLRDVPVTYWGDLDTHGFAILDRLRAWLPQARAVLMDRATLLAHRDRWVAEERPAASLLTRLTDEERALYTALVTDALGERVRLEQERVDWACVQAALGQVDRGGERS